ncbi:MAG TPA: hypothetical protein VF322_12890 [Gammaproteobacteria bacterium]
MHNRSKLIRSFASAVALGGLALAAGCGSGSGTGAMGRAGAGGQLEATFDSIQRNIFTPICTACHAGASAPAGLRLDETNSYGLLVGVPSSEQGHLLRVDPGNPDQSYLIQKLEGTAAVGGRMPLGGAPLAQADIDVIRQWILEGAQRSASPAAPTSPIRVSSLSPLPGSTVSALPASIIAMFDREPNAATVNVATFLVDRSGGDGSFAEGNEVPVMAASVTVPIANPRSAVFDLTGVPSVEDTYRVRLLGSGPSVILDLGGQALDGELGAALPSGDGAAGGDFVATFVVAGIQPTLASIQSRVFTPVCSQCHTGPPSTTLPQGMDLSSAQASFGSLVGVASIEQPMLQRVAPGDPDASYVVHKIEGAPSIAGDPMPLGGPPLDAATIAAIRQWIANGAAP